MHICVLPHQQVLAQLVDGQNSLLQPCFRDGRVGDHVDETRRVLVERDLLLMQCDVGGTLWMPNKTEQTRNTHQRRKEI
jgi:hypothetical protein